VLLEELVLGDLVCALGKLPTEILNIGYYEAHRLWLILDENKARDLLHMHMVLDSSQASQEYRTTVWEWLQDRQPRRYPKQEPMPRDLWDRIQNAFKDEGVKNG
jgi:hypothetical protein